MLDYQRIVEEIQAAVQSQGTLDWDLLRDASAEYAAACDEVNVRLDRIARLLRQGLRSEAIQLADHEPPLLDGAAILDFPELPEWIQLLAVNGMVPPPAIRIDAAAELNAAYAAEAPLQSLMKSHRLLALSRAPLAARIQVLRSIRRVDQMTPIWTEDLRILETARHQELQREVESCVARRDLARLDGLCQELTYPAWIHHPGRDIVERATRIRQTLAAAIAKEELREIEQVLSAAYSAFDVVGGGAARERWNQRSIVAALAPTDELAIRAAPALAWLAEQDHREARDREFAASLAGLEQGLENEADRSTLERLFHTTQRFDEKLPDLVQRRYYERIRQFETAGRRRFVVMVAAVLGGLLLAGGVTGWVLYRNAEYSRTVASAKQLAQLIDNNQWQQAEDYFTTLQAQQPLIAARPEMQGQLARLKGLQAKEKDRRDTFLMHLERAQDSDSSRPDLLALVEAKKLAATSAEKSEVAKLDAQFTEQERQRQRQRDEQFESHFGKILSDVEATETDLDRMVSRDSIKLNELLAEIDALEKRAPGVSQALLAQLQPLRLRIVRLKKEDADRLAQQSALAKLTEAVGKPAAYTSALNDFAARFPDSPLGDELQLVAGEAPLWEELQQWSDFLSDTRFAERAKIPPAVAKQLSLRGKELLSNAGQCPLANGFQNRQEFLEAIANRAMEKGETRVDVLQEVFDDVFIAGLSCVETKSGERYYLAKDFNLFLATGADPVPFEYVTGFDLETVAKRLKKAEVIRHGPAPQSRLTTTARVNLKLARDGEWEKGMYSLMRSIIEQSDADPLLRVILLQRVLETGQQGSRSLKVAFSSTAERLKSADVDVTANWLLPNDAAAQAARAKSKALLEAIGDISEQAKAAAELLRNDTADLPPRPKWIGWLRPAEANSWTCECPRPPGEGNLYAIHWQTRAPGSEVQWDRIGTWSSVGVEWDLTKSNAFAAGRPVYLVIDSTDINAPASAGR
jgi:hypothetical protein